MFLVAGFVVNVTVIATGMVVDVFLLYQQIELTIDCRFIN